jgi:hypothetical protein
MWTIITYVVNRGHVQHVAVVYVYFEQIRCKCKETAHHNVANNDTIASQNERPPFISPRRVLNTNIARVLGGEFRVAQHLQVRSARDVNEGRDGDQSVPNI